MIDVTLRFLADELNAYLALQSGMVAGDMKLVLGHVSRVAGPEQAGGDEKLQNRAVMSLVNVEEDRLSRTQEAIPRRLNGAQYAEPPVSLNLYVLLVMNIPDHELATRWLSAVIRFFQHQSVFAPQSHAGLDPAILQLSVSMESLSFEQSSQLWSTLGGRYLPSVLYKVRQVSVDERIGVPGAGAAHGVTTNDATKQPIS